MLTVVLHYKIKGDCPQQKNIRQSFVQICKCFPGCVILTSSPGNMSAGFYWKFKGKSWATLFYAAKSLRYLFIYTFISTVPDITWSKCTSDRTSSNSQPLLFLSNPTASGVTFTSNSNVLLIVLNFRNDIKSECGYYLVSLRWVALMK